MLLKELHNILTEGAVADKYEELKDSAQKCAPYIYVDARPAEGEDIGSRLRSIGIPSVSHEKQEVKKGDYVARIVMTGSVKNQRPMAELFLLDKETFTLFTQLKNTKADVEGFIPYEAEGEEMDVVKDGSRFIVKSGKDLTQMPASLFNKQYRIKGD